MCSSDLMKAAASAPSIPAFLGSPPPTAPIAINSEAAAAATAPLGLGLGGQPQTQLGLGLGLGGQPTSPGASGHATGVNLGGIQITHWPWPWPYTNQ